MWTRPSGRWSWLTGPRILSICRFPSLSRRANTGQPSSTYLDGKNGQKRTAEAGLSILVALDTEHMGRVETLIRQEGGGISLEFRLQEPAMTEAFKKNSRPLQEAVEAAGYSLTGMRFAGLEKKTTVLNAGEMVSLDAGDASHGIDVQI